MRMIDDEGTRVHDHLNPAVVAIEIRFEHQHARDRTNRDADVVINLVAPGATTPSMRPSVANQSRHVLSP